MKKTLYFATAVFVLLFIGGCASQYANSPATNNVNAYKGGTGINQNSVSAGQDQNNGETVNQAGDIEVESNDGLEAEYFADDDNDDLKTVCCAQCREANRMDFRGRYLENETCADYAGVRATRDDGTLSPTPIMETRCVEYFQQNQLAVMDCK